MSRGFRVLPQRLAGVLDVEIYMKLGNVVDLMCSPRWDWKDERRTEIEREQQGRVSSSGDKENHTTIWVQSESESRMEQI